MNFREFNAKYLEPGSLWFMVIGVVALCQPWIAVLHAYSVLITLVGIIGFNIASHIPPPDKAEDEEEVAPGMSAPGDHHG
jgi:hypothetical protein